MNSWFFSWQMLTDSVWLVFLLLILRFFWKEKASLKHTQCWLKTTGKIQNFDWVYEDEYVWPNIEYIYEVKGKTYTGTNLFLEVPHYHPPGNKARLVAYNIAMAHKNKEEIEVYYNPEKPEQCALDVSVSPKLNVVMLLIAILIVIHVMMMAYHYLHY